MLRRRFAALFLASLAACGTVTDPEETEPVGPRGTTDEPTSDAGPWPSDRLKGREIASTIEDVLGVHLEAEEWLPEDPSERDFGPAVGGADVLPAWLDALYAMAVEAADRTDRPVPAPPPTSRITMQGEAMRWSEGLADSIRLIPFGAAWVTDRTTTTTLELPPGTTWTPTVWLLLETQAEPLRVTVSIDDVGIGVVTLLAGADPLRARVDGPPLEPGWHTLTLTLLPDAAGDPPRERDRGYSMPPFVGVDALHFQATSPLPAEAPSTPTPVLVCEDGSPVDDDCAGDLIRRLARRLWRRTPSEDDMASLVGLYEARRRHRTGPTAAMRDVIVALLVSPSFVYRHATERPDTPDAWSVAERLSLALWGSAPDDELLACAESGGLRLDDEPCGLRAQRDRLLADPRAMSLVDDLMLPWLGIDRLETLWIHPQYNPDWSPLLFRELKNETRRMVARARAERTDLRDLLTQGASDAGWQAAVMYGVEPTSFVEPVSLDLDALGRPGLLGQGSILAATARGSMPTHTDRAVWVLETLLCRPPPPPPADFPPLDTTDDPENALDRHLSEPACVTCHAQIDPHGAPMGAFDLIGRRTRPDRPTSLPDGTVVDDVAAFAAWLRAEPELAECMVERVAGWVLGRQTNPGERDALHAIQQAAEADGFHLDAIVRATTESPLFVPPEESP